jgi:hypothetical protein
MRLVTLWSKDRFGPFSMFGPFFDETEQFLDNFKGQKVHLKLSSRKVRNLQSQKVFFQRNSKHLQVYQKKYKIRSLINFSLEMINL